MPQNPFKANKNYENKPNRNSFDLSHTNNLTFNIGQLIPVYCEEVLPGDSFEIDSALGLRFMPLNFPIQTKLRAHVHFFYQRTKNLWPGFLDFINGNDKINGTSQVHPYIDFSNTTDPGTLNGSGSSKYLLQTGSLGDYLGLPTISYGRFGIDNPLTKFTFASGLYDVYGSEGKPVPLTANFVDWIKGVSLSSALHPTSGTPVLSTTIYQAIVFVGGVWPRSKDNKVVLTINRNIIDFNPDNVYIVAYAGEGSNPGYMDTYIPIVTTTTYFDEDRNIEVPAYRLEFVVPADMSTGAAYQFTFALCSQFINYTTQSPFYGTGYSYPINLDFSDAVFDASGNILTDTNYFHVNALPFRCYESIYNAFYRDERNNPLRNGGKTYYNKYLLNDGSGADSTRYDLHYRNWELDQFTSSVQSPQQGVAPLVGITSLGDVTFQDENGKSYTFSSETGDDADTITKINVTENVPNSVARSIVNVVTSGISINDFRNVNAYQRWLETNIRRGLKYKDQVAARWGVTPADSTLDMPEFIGGYSVDVDINTVTNVASTEQSPLGEYAANASAFGGSSHKIRQYCDQHGYIMAILSVAPIPVYSQLLPKMFLRETALDYYQPEFSQIGLQPITYRELCPLEVRLPTDLTKTFGYQRPWYDYIYRNDTAHGLFRSSMSQFLMSRTFYNLPSLNSDFLTVNDTQLNDVFSVEQPHKVLGQIRFNIEAKRPIPSISIPSL